MQYINYEFIESVRKNDLNSVIYLSLKGADIHRNCDEAIYTAISNGSLEIVKYLMSIGHYYNNDECINLTEYAASKGFLEITKYFISTCPNIKYLYNNSLVAAAKNDHIHILKYLFNLEIKHIEGRIYHITKAISQAAMYGKLNSIQYILSEITYPDIYLVNGFEGIPINIKYEKCKNPRIELVNAIYNAAKYGHLQVLKYLSCYYPQGLPYIINSQYECVNEFINSYNSNPKLMNIYMKNIFLMTEYKYYLLIILVSDDFLIFKDTCPNNIVRFFKITSRLNLDIQQVIANILVNSKKRYIINFNSFIQDPYVMNLFFL